MSWRPSRAMRWRVDHAYAHAIRAGGLVRVEAVGSIARHLAALAWPADMEPLTYVCGPTGFVEAVASVLVDLGHEPERILTERFGPTGG